MSFGAKGRAMPRNKYGNSKTIVNGTVFDSKKESKRYSELCLLLRAGLITDLTLQKSFELQPKFRYNDKGERAINYIADFSYFQDGKEIVEDVKGFKTKEYLLKRKMFLYRYPEIDFREIF